MNNYKINKCICGNEDLIFTFKSAQDGQKVGIKCYGCGKVLDTIYQSKQIASTIWNNHISL